MAVAIHLDDEIGARPVEVDENAVHEHVASRLGQVGLANQPEEPALQLRLGPGDLVGTLIERRGEGVGARVAGRRPSRPELVQVQAA